MISSKIWNDLLFTSVFSDLHRVQYTDNDWLNELVQHVLRGSYEQMFNENLHLKDFLTIDSIEIKNQLNNDQELIELLRMILAVSFLQMFIIENFLGPETTLKLDEEQSINSVESLISDGETPVSTGKHYEFLVNALKIFHPNSFCSSRHWSYHWWTIRTLFIHQKMLEERSMTLHDEIQKSIDELSKYQNEMEKTQSLLFSIEMTYVCQYYYDWKQGERWKSRAIELSDLDINLTGLLGKRTRYQVKNTSQLLLDVTRKSSENSSNDENHFREISTILPKNLSLNDDVVLNEIQFDVEHSSIPLNVIEQLTLLLVINDRQVNNPKHEITTEEQLAFLTFILSRPINWSIQTSSLILRCHHETENKRKIERTLLQLQELIDQYDRPTPSSFVRLEHFHSTPMIPMWKLKNDVADVYVKIGLINSALDLYLHLKKWTDVIHCYQMMKKLSLAEHVIREQLKLKETPDLLCSLGEVTNEFEHFERAWLLSKERSGRAQRLMGKFYFNRGNYEKACEHLVKAVEINSLQHDTWFWLGSAAFRTDKWELGIRAYSRCTNIEPDNFEAWNNLAACHTKLKQKDKAHKVFLEAIKCNFDNWKVWENFLWTSADCAEIDDLIQAYHRLIDLKTKYVDKQVLQRLIQLLTNSEQDESWKRIYQKSLELFGRLTSQVTNDADIWEFYSDLCQLKPDETSIEWDTKILQQLQRAHRCAISQTSSWENEIETMNHVVHLSNKLAKITTTKLNEHDENENFKPLCHSIRLALNSVITRLKQKYDLSAENITSDETLNENIRLLEKLLSQLNEILLKG